MENAKLINHSIPDVQFGTRMHGFAIVSAIESDLRELIRRTLGEVNAKDAMPRDVFEATKRRLEADKPDDWYQDEEPLAGLLIYADFLDTAKILSSNRNVLSAQQSDALSKAVPLLEKASPVRNRVCHSRPLEEDDFRVLVDTAEGLRLTGLSNWHLLRSCLEKLRDDPSWAMSLKIPRFWAAAVRSTIHNNIPLPEFDETGFLGRDEDRKALMAHLLGAFPMICIVGDGGFGKTALALRVLYDLIDQVDRGLSCPFDAIIWVSLKVRALTTAGIREIDTAIKDSVGLFAEIASELGAPINEDLTPPEVLAEISGYLKSFKVLLAIDNCESLPVADVTQFFQEIPIGSKVLLTSRTGLNIGALDYRIDSLASTPAQRLFRKYAKLLNVQDLLRLPNRDVAHLVKALYYNPLFIKWFIGSVAGGVTVESLLSKRSSGRQEFLRFCFESQFESLGPLERGIVQVLQIAGRRLTRTQIFLALELAQIEEVGLNLDLALRRLVVSGVLRHEAAGFAEIEAGRYSSYFLGEAALDYLQGCAQPDPRLFKRIREWLSKVQKTSERDKSQLEQYKYLQTAIHARGKDQELVGTILKHAMNSARAGSIEEAKTRVAKAEEYLPEFSEIYRIGAFISTLAEDPYGADQYYQRALLVDPSSVISKYSYALFLMSPMANDLERAADLLKSVLVKDPAAVPVMAALGRCLTRLGQYQEAVSLLEACLQHSDPNNIQQIEQNSKHLSGAYTRWAQSLLVRSDSKSFSKLIEKALAPLETCALKGLWNDHLHYQLSVVGKIGLEGAVRNNSPELIDVIASSVRGNWYCSNQPLQLLDQLEDAFRAFGSRESITELEKLLKSSGAEPKSYEYKASFEI